MFDFTLRDTAQDFEEMRAVLAEFYHPLPDDAWDNSTGNREKDWTLHEVTAHLVSVARLLNTATEAALDSRPLHLENFLEREDLREWNAIEIAALTQDPGDKLVSELMTALRRSRDWAAALTDEQAVQTLEFVVYNRAAPVRNLIDWQLSHIGIVHGAQVSRAVSQPPLWTMYSTEFKHRQLDRFMRHFSWAYWNTLKPDVHAAINFHVEGESGGEWLLVAAPDGGKVSQRSTDRADYTLTFADADTMFSVFTVERPLKDALQSGDLQVADDKWRDAFELLRFFSPSPPQM